MPKPQPRLSGDLLGVAKGDAAAAPQTAPSRIALTLRLEPELHERLRRAAFDQRRPMQDIILEALASHLGG